MPKGFRELAKLVAAGPADLKMPLASPGDGAANQADIEAALRERYGLFLSHIGVDPLSPFAAAAALNKLLPLIFDGFVVRPEKRGRRPIADEELLRAHELFRRVTGKSRYDAGQSDKALTSMEWQQIVVEDRKAQQPAFPLSGAAREIDTARDWLRKAQLVIDARASVFAATDQGILRRSGIAEPQAIGEMLASRIEISRRRQSARLKKQRAK